MEKSQIYNFSIVGCVSLSYLLIKNLEKYIEETIIMNFHEHFQVEEGVIDVSSDEHGNLHFSSGMAVQILHDLQYMLHFT